jgi:adiponectin receptor
MRLLQKAEAAAAAARSEWASWRPVREDAIEGTAWAYMRAPHVRRGYRARLTWWQSMSSLFRWHNETLNIWTHVGGATLFAHELWRVAHVDVAHEDVAHEDVAHRRGPLCVFLATAVACMCMSAAFHLLWHHSSQVYARAMRVDYAGVVLLTGGSHYSLVCYALGCAPGLAWWRGAYQLLTLLAGGATLALSSLERFATPAWATTRMVAFVGYGAVGVLPAAHLLLVRARGGDSGDGGDGGDNGDGGDEATAGAAEALGYIVGEWALYLGGVAIFMGRVPERWAPGRFDYVGWSHQLWHLCTIAAAAMHERFCLEAMASARAC